MKTKNDLTSLIPSQDYTVRRSQNSLARLLFSAGWIFFGIVIFLVETPQVSHAGSNAGRRKLPLKSIAVLNFQKKNKVSLTTVQIFHDGQFFATANFYLNHKMPKAYTLSVWRTSNCHLVSSADIPMHTMFDAGAFLASGDFVIRFSWQNNLLSIMRATNLLALKKLKTENSITEIIPSPNGRVAVVKTAQAPDDGPDTGFRVLDIAQFRWIGATQSELDKHNASDLVGQSQINGHCIGFLNDTTILVEDESTTGKALYAYDVRAGRRISVPRLKQLFDSVALSGSDTYKFTQTRGLIAGQSVADRPTGVAVFSIVSGKRILFARSTRYGQFDLSDDGTGLLVKSRMAIKLYNLSTGRCIATFSDAHPSKRYPSESYAIFIDEGRFILSGGNRDDNHIIVRDGQTGKVQGAFDASGYDLADAVVAHGTPFFALVDGHKGSVQIWKAISN